MNIYLLTEAGGILTTESGDKIYISTSVEPVVPPVVITQEYHAGVSAPFLGPALKITYTNYPQGYEAIFQLEAQNADDMEIIQVLTEWLAKK